MPFTLVPLRRRHHRGLRLILIALVFGALTVPIWGEIADVKGSKDHPTVSRYTGAVIIGHEVRKFDEFAIPLGAVTFNAARQAFEPSKSQRVEGMATRILYVGPAERSTLEIMRNYEAELKKAGFETIYSCADAQCAVANALANYLYPGKRYLRQTPPGSGDISAYALSYPGEQRYLAAKRSRPEGELYVSLYIATNKVTVFKETANRPMILLDVIEPARMETGMVTVDAAAMAKDISSTGSVTLYGIYFDTDKTDVKPESQPTLQEIAKLLKQDASLRLYVVGHTDNVGTYDHNLDLSQRRAAAVVSELTTKYGVAVARLRPAGVGMLSPIAPNDNEQGRAKNRRVELVKQ
jgi:OmpA-OmpF porin, OOP family